MIRINETTGKKEIVISVPDNEFLQNFQKELIKAVRNYDYANSGELYFCPLWMILDLLESTLVIEEPTKN